MRSYFCLLEGWTFSAVERLSGGSAHSVFIAWKDNTELFIAPLPNTFSSPHPYAADLTLPPKITPLLPLLLLPKPRYCLLLETAVVPGGRHDNLPLPFQRLQAPPSPPPPPRTQSLLSSSLLLLPELTAARVFLSGRQGRRAASAMETSSRRFSFRGA